MNQTRPVLTLKRPARARKKPEQVRPARHARAVAEAPPRRTPSDEELLVELQALAPELWNPDAPVPLAIGIHRQLYPLAERLQMSRRGLRKFLSRWTASEGYRQALAETGARRYDLDGSPAGEVSEEHRDEARQQLEAKRSAEAARRAGVSHLPRSSRRDFTTS